LSKEAVLCSAAAVNRHFQIDSSDIWINVLPTCHVGGDGIFVRAFFSGSSVINYFNEKIKWNPKAIVKRVGETKATLTALVPTQLHDLIKENIRAPESLRAVVIGGGALNSILESRGVELGWRLFPSYGLTECASQVAT